MTTKQVEEASAFLTTRQVKAAELAAKLRSRAPLIVCVTPEEAAVKRYIFEGCAAAKYEARFWDISRGFTDISKKVIMGDRGQGNADEALEAIKENTTRVAWVMCDLSPWINPPIGMITARTLKNLIDDLPERAANSAQSIILITASKDLPPEIANEAQFIEWPMPDRDEMDVILQTACDPVLDSTAVREDGSAVIDKDTKKAVLASITGDYRSAAVDAAIGLSESEARSCFATSLVMNRRIDPVSISREKKGIIAKEKLMEWIDPPEGGFLNVGGWENYKDWASLTKMAYTPAAREYGLETPKGVFLFGISGCGKSLCAKATGSEWGVPVIKLDLNALKAKFVGDSEQNLRKALSIIEALGWCIVWIDELEKALAGAVSGSADGGVSADALGTILTWMQDRPGQAFVIATANDVSSLPPELMRKGRFDEIWFVDLPTQVERAQIAAAALRARGRDAATMSDMDLEAVAAATETFTGAEIDALVPTAMRVGFAEGQREITTQDLLNAAKEVVPLAETKKETIDELRRTWATRAKPVTRADTFTPGAVSVAGSRQLDF